jgi:hypothetical protein
MPLRPRPSLPVALHRLIRWALLVLASLAGGAATGARSHTVEAQDRTLEILRLVQEIEVRPDGVLEIEETLDVRFIGSWNGIRRELLSAHETADGRGGRLRYSILGATDYEGRRLRVEEESMRGGIRVLIHVPGAENARHVVRLRYEVQGAIRFFTEELVAGGRAGPDAPDAPFDELYWNATGSGWDVPLRDVRVRVRIPDEASGLRAWGYTGRPGATEQGATVEVAGPQVEVAVLNPVAAGEELTLSVIWDAGVIARPRPSLLAGPLRVLFQGWPLVLPLLAALFTWRAWTRTGRDPAPRAIVVQYFPPEGLSPAEAGTLIDGRAEIHDITATLVDLAVRGWITIEEMPQTVMLGRLTGRSTWTFHQLRQPAEWGALADHECAYLEGLFSPASGGKRVGTSPGPYLASVSVDQLANQFYRHLPRIRGAIHDALVAARFYERRPDHVVTRWALAGSVLLTTGVVGGAILASRPSSDFLPSPLNLGLGLGISGLLLLICSRWMGARTEAGARMQEQVLGFREFVKRVEAPQYRRMITSPEMFERYLAYALALRVEDRWATAFEGMLRQPPQWYRSPAAGTAFDPARFGTQLRQLSTATSRASASSPSSSGSGGGGRAGGGSGGGGGGGF